MLIKEHHMESRFMLFWSQGFSLYFSMVLFLKKKSDCSVCTCGIAQKVGSWGSAAMKLETFYCSNITVLYFMFISANE